MVITNNGNILENSGIISGNVIQQQGLPVKPCLADQKPKTPQRAAFTYDVALSYAGEQETFVHDVAQILETEELRVFFAPNCSSVFKGENMLSQFYRIYRYDSFFVAAFVTDDYLCKEITMHEAATAMLRQRDEGRSCLIPIYFGGAKLPRLDPKINYISADGLLAVELADQIKSIILSINRYTK